MGRPRVLFLTGHLPYPPISGGRRREYELLARLGGDFDIHLFVLSKTPEEDAANTEALRELCAGIEVVPAAWLPGDPVPPPTMPELVLRHWAPDLTRRVTEVIERDEVDLVHVEGFYLMHHVPAEASVPVLLVEQNIEYSVWHQRMRLSPTRKEQRRRVAQYAMTLQAEIDAWKRSSLCAAVTEEDRATMLEAVPGLEVRVVPDGADHRSDLEGSGPGRSEGLSPDDGAPTVVFVGNFLYAPNVDAATYLCAEILPHIRSRVPEARLYLVGNAPPPEVAALGGDGVVVTGRVDSVEPYLDSATVVVCPLREGGGVKVKMLEALSRGKAVVTTSVGAQGLGDGAAACLEIHDRPRHFARAVVELIRNQEDRRRLERAAREFALGLPSWDDAAKALAGCYRELLERP